MCSELKDNRAGLGKPRAALKEESVRQAVRQTVELVDKGLRTAQPVDPEKSQWQVNEWVKKAIILYFPIQPMRKMEAGGWSGTTRCISSTATNSWACRAITP